MSMIRANMIRVPTIPPPAPPPWGCAIARICVIFNLISNLIVYE
jgi:hypothetical protein